MDNIKLKFQLYHVNYKSIHTSFFDNSIDYCLIEAVKFIAFGLQTLTLLKRKPIYDSDQKCMWFKRSVHFNSSTPLDVNVFNV